MKVIFFGTGDFGLPSLEVLRNHSPKHHLLAVVTGPDKPQGRNLKVMPSPVKSWALHHDLPIHEMTRQNALDHLPIFQDYKADVFVVISFGVILPKTLLNLPKKVALNVHSSLLPFYRGPAPIEWALWKGDAKTGVTVMRMAETLDTGDILMQAETAISQEDTSLTLEKRLAQMGSQLLIQSLEILEEGSALWKPQDESRATYARKINKQDGHVEWGESADQVSRRIRALAGRQAAFSQWGLKRLLLLQVETLPEYVTDAKPGTVLQACESTGILIATGKGVVDLRQLQLEGKKALTASDFLRGSTIKPGDILE